MTRFFLILLSISLVTGCATRPNRTGVMSEELPLTLDDIAEIREGEKNHIKVLEEYYLYESPKLETYLNAIAASIAEVSTRPHLPYQVILLDDDEVNIFGGPGGYIYVTRGFLSFIESESEIAGAMSHEIAHIAGMAYSGLSTTSRTDKIYKWLEKGSGLASDSIGSYGTAMKYGLKTWKKAEPILQKRYGRDEEVEADKAAVDFLIKAGYDPREYLAFNEKLARVDIHDVSRFAHFMNSHPPFVERRENLDDKIGDIDFESGEIEFRKDMLNEVRQVTVNRSDSSIFAPALGSHLGSPMDLNETAVTKNEKFIPQRKRWSWF